MSDVIKDRRDIDGNPVTLDKLCRLEPAWAASRIRVMEAELEALREMREALMAVERDVAENAEDTSYGYPCVEDPRDYTPDEESCTEAEIANWKAACAAWERGEGQPVPDPHTDLVDGDGRKVGHVTMAPMGVGTNVHRDPRWERVRAALMAAWERK